MKRRRILVGFGDILGFASWTQRAINAPEESMLFIENVYKEFEEFALNTGYYVKFLGDGLMIIKEIREKSLSNYEVGIEFIKKSYDLSIRIQKLIQDHWPRPDGFRLRITSGHVYRRNTAKNGPEYVGYSINLAQRLLECSPKITCICHESVVEILKKKKGKDTYKLDHLAKVKERPRGIDQVDLQGLWSFEYGHRKDD